MTYLNEYLLKKQTHLKIHVFRHQSGNGESVSLKSYKRKEITEIIMGPYNDSGKIQLGKKCLQTVQMCILELTQAMRRLCFPKSKCSIRFKHIGV